MKKVELIPFSRFIKDKEILPMDINLEAMLENSFKMRDIMNKMFVIAYPKHPEFVMYLFADPNFADELLSLVHYVKDVSQIYIDEFPEVMRQKLIEAGVLYVESLFERYTKMYGVTSSKEILIGIIPGVS